MRPDGSKESATEVGSLTDERLLQFFEAGDQAAFEAIIERHEARLARIAYRIVGCMHEAEDVRHAVFVRLLQVGRQRTKLGNIGAWLTRCTVNEAITRVRHKSLEGHECIHVRQQYFCAKSNTQRVSNFRSQQLPLTSVPIGPILEA